LISCICPTSRALDRDLRGRNAGFGQQRAAFRLKLVQRGVHRGSVESRGHPDGMRAHTLEAQRRDEKAQARRRARRGRNDHLANAENARNTRRVRRASATEANHRVGARVLALLDQVDARGRRHALGHDLVDAMRGFDCGHPQFSAELSRRDHRGPPIKHHPPTKEKCGIVEAEHQIGVGHRCLGAAAPVAGRPRIGTRRTRADA